MAVGSRTFVVLFGCGLACSVLHAPVAAQCQLCGPSAAAAAKKPAPRPITVTTEASIDFANIGLVRINQGGTAQINATTGQRILTGNLIDLGGIPVVGTALIRGEPKEHVEVSLPASVEMFNSAGASYRLSNFTTTAKNNPKIGDDGTLRFNFGAMLQITGAATGTFRGSIPITVEYK